MPRYLIEPSFQDRLAVPPGAEGADACRGVIERNGLEGVTWIHSYVSDDRRKTFLRLRRPQPRGHPQDRRAQRIAGEHDHRSAR